MKKLLVFITLLSLLAVSCRKNPEQPNIIFILADDLGYMDIQEYAFHTLGTDKDSMFYETPHLNRLVNEGIAFEQAYANQLCSPTRASLLTGKYPARLGFTTATPRRDTYYNRDLATPEGSYLHDVLDHHDKIDIEMAWINGSTNTAIPSGAAGDDGWDETTIAEALSGYHSAFIGKWHVGGHGAPGYTPADQGFEALAWFDAGGSAYFKWRPEWDNRSTKHFPEFPAEELVLGYSGKETGEEYLTDDLTEQALDFIEERSQVEGEPFFLYFCHFAVHSPNQAKKDDVAYFEGKDTKGWNEHSNATYAGMLSSLDQSVGKILQKLEETGLEDNTLVVFMSDNGGIDSKIIPRGTVTNNFPLSGGKACLTEGGVRVPLVFRWKGVLDAGLWSKVQVDCNDIFPTLLDMAGYDPRPYYEGEDPIDGRSIAGLWSDIDNSNGTYQRDTRYWHYPFNVIYNNPYDGFALTPHSAIMEGDYKLIFDWQGRVQLFNIAEDLSETNNLTAQMPEKTDELFAKLMHWLESNVKDTYLPHLNPAYNPEKEVRDESFVNLYEAFQQGSAVSEILSQKYQ